MKKGMSFLVGSVVFVLLFVMMSPHAVAENQTKISDLESHEIADDANDLLREQFADILGVVRTKPGQLQPVFNSITATDSIAILNMTVNGVERRILTRIRDANLLGTPSLNQVLIRTTDLVAAGNITVGGHVYKSVDGEYGTRAFFGVHSAKARLVDEGTSRLTNGEANVSLNPVFSDAIDSYTVFISPQGLTQGMYVAEKTPTHFVVRSVNADSNVAFSWMVRGVESAYSDVYLDSFERDTAITVTIDYENETSDVVVVSRSVDEFNETSTQTTSFTSYYTTEDDLIDEAADFADISLEQTRRSISFRYATPRNFQDEILQAVGEAQVDGITRTNGSIVITLG